MHPAEATSAKAEGTFSVSSRRLEEGILVAPSGDVDLATAAVLEEELRRAELSESLIVLDLDEVTFMDSTGLRTVVSADQRLRERCGSLRLVHVPSQVKRLFELVGVRSHLTIDDGVDVQTPEPPKPPA
jgi:anti-anti-sigma factor